MAIKADWRFIERLERNGDNLQIPKVDEANCLYLLYRVTHVGVGGIFTINLTVTLTLMLKICVIYLYMYSVGNILTNVLGIRIG